MKLAKTSPALPVLRRKKGRKRLKVVLAVAGVLSVLIAAAWFFLLRGSVSLTPDEQELVGLINEKRRNNLIGEVRVDAKLCQVAQRHAQWMCDQQRAEVPQVAVLTDYLQAVNYPYQDWGVLVDRQVNHGPKWIFATWSANPNTEGEVKGFRHTDVGVSILPDPNDAQVWYVTVIFGSKK